MVVPGSQQLAPAFFGVVAAAAFTVAVITFIRRQRRRRREPDLPRRRPVVLAVALTVALVASGLTVVSRPPPFFVPRFGPLPRLLPPEAFFYRTVADLPVSVDSRRWIAALGGQRLSPGISGDVVDGVVFGIPFNLVNRATPTRDVSIKLTPATSYPGPYPISDPAYIESMPTYGFDQHYIAVDARRRLMWELLSTRSWFGRWEADSGALWRMDRLSYGQGSTIAAGLPLLPGTVTYDEVARGHVEHAILATISISAGDRSVWPARGTDGRSTNPDAPPQGAWLRLRGDVDLTGLGPQARVIAEGMRDHGVILSDTSPGFALRGTPDGRWDNGDLGTLSSLSTADFDVVDPTSIIVSPDSLAAKPPR